MSDDRRTKAQLLAELERESRRAEDAAERVSALERQVKTSAPERVPEADALAGCVRALDAIAKRSVSSYSQPTSDQKTQIRNVLLMLHDKYGIPRAEKERIPCTRRHIEDLNTTDLFEAIRRDPGFTFTPAA